MTHRTMYSALTYFIRHRAQRRISYKQAQITAAFEISYYSYTDTNSILHETKATHTAENFKKNAICTSNEK